MIKPRPSALFFLGFFALGFLLSNLAFAGGEPYVIFWSTEKCGKKCKGNGMCFTALASNGWAHHNLSELQDTWTEVTKWAWVGGIKEGDREAVETEERSMTWENKIWTVYIRHPMTEVRLYDETDFEGEPVRLYGAGCHNLANWNFRDRAESIQVE